MAIAVYKNQFCLKTIPSSALWAVWQDGAESTGLFLPCYSIVSLWSHAPNTPSLLRGIARLVISVYLHSFDWEFNVLPYVFTSLLKVNSVAPATWTVCGVSAAKATNDPRTTEMSREVQAGIPDAFSPLQRFTAACCSLPFFLVELFCAFFSCIAMRNSAGAVFHLL